MAAAADSRLLVMYASETGNAMDAAERVGRQAERGGCPAVHVLPMDSFDPSCLPSQRFVVFVVSTTGQGDPPDSMKGFWRYLLNKNLGARWLQGVQYAVFGLGGSGYHKYNFAAKKLDRRLLHLGAEPIIQVRAKDMVKVSKVSLLNGFIDCIKLKTFVALTMDVASASPRQYFFEVMSFFATVEHEKEKLQYFASPEGRDDLYQYNQKEGRTVLAVLEDFPSVQMPFEWLVQLTPPLKKRAFSISSSPLAKPNQIHLTVSIVSWRTPFKRTRRGLCSSWLAGLNPNEENLIPCWVHHCSLPPPHPSTPLILIGPGTGCAPFRAFVAERAARSTPEPTAPIVFFFSCRNLDNDFLYKEFWYAHAHDQGVLSSKNGGGLFVAFSRDQPQKVYVQHRIKEHSARVWNLLKSGAAIYIAGSSTKMPADVTAALEEVICQESGCSEEDASIWLRKLERNGKFHTETWS